MGRVSEGVLVAAKYIQIFTSIKNFLISQRNLRESNKWIEKKQKLRGVCMPPLSFNINFQPKHLILLVCVPSNTGGFEYGKCQPST